MSWEEDKDLITAPELSSGHWDAVSWVRSRLGDVGLGEWLISRNGAGLSPPRLRLWELMLELPRQKVEAWL